MLGMIMAAAFALTVAAEGGQAAGQGAQGGRGRGGFSIPPLLMESDAFPDGGVVPQKYAGRTGVQP